MTYDVAHAAQIIGASQKPLLLIDTCSLLDIVRTPVRETLNANHIQGSVDVLSNLAAGNLHVAVTTTVLTEFHEHLQATCEELEKHAKGLEAKTANYVRASSIAGLPLAAFGSLGGQALSNKLSQYATDLLASAVIIERDRDCGHRAHDRVEIHHAPASRGKSESKDCLIIEHFLDLVQRLRRSGYTKKTVFVTNNSNDYGPPNAPLPPLNSQFTAAGITYCNNFSWAVKEVLTP